MELGEGSRKYNELKQGLAGKMRTLCWHTEEGTEYICCTYPSPFKKRSHRNNRIEAEIKGCRKTLRRQSLRI